MEESVCPSDQVDATDRAAGGVEERRRRRGCLRATREPDMQREQRRLGGRRDEDEDGNGEEPVGTDPATHVLAGQRLEVELVETKVDVGDGRQQREVANRRNDEGADRGGRRLFPLPPVAD